jgi:zinc protease
MARPRGYTVVLVLLLALVTMPAPPASAQRFTPGRESDKGIDPRTPLPVDERLTIGALDNGLRYVIKPHANPPGKVGVWLHIATGSMNETDAQRGLAHYLEHMAFNGSENFPPGELIKYFESIGMTFGRDQNAFTSFDQTAYQLYLPDTARATLAKGLLFFSDVAGRLLLREEDIEEERGVIFEELRTDRGPQQRLRDQWLERLAPGSLLGVRLPIGTEETLASVGRDDFVDYYTRWYIPSKMTVIVVGDMDPGVAAEEIARAFGGLEARPRPEAVDAGVEPYRERRVIVAHDPELTEAQVAVMLVEAPEPPSVDVGGMRRDLARQIAIESFNRRLAGKVDEGEARMLGGGAFAQSLFNALRFSQASASSEPSGWREALEDLTIEVRRAELHGFSEQEVEVARAAVLASLEQLADQEQSLPARVILSILASQVNAGVPPTGPRQALELARRIVAEIGTGEVNRSFSDLFDTSRAAFLVTLPSGAGVPEEDALLALASGLADQRPEPEEDRSLADSLLEREPVPGEIVELGIHEASGVSTAVLSNGVIVHHRHMPERSGFVEVRISLRGGVIEESGDNRGITEAAAQVFNRHAVGALTSREVRQLMAGRKVQVSGSALDDLVQISMTGSPDDLETGFQLAYRLLTDPRLETTPFEQWRTGMIQGINAARMDPIQSLPLVMQDTMYPEDAPQARPVTVEQLERLSMRSAQAWLDRLVAESPIEAAIVGDITRDAAMELARNYLASLPPRPVMDDSTPPSFRTIPPPSSDRIAEVAVATRTPSAGVIAGFFASDMEELRDTRLLQLASRTLSSRMIERLREQERLVYSIGAQLLPGMAFPGYGLMLAGSATDPARAVELADRIDAIFAEFAENGPTAEELATAKAQIAKLLNESMEEPGYWASHLGALRKRGRTLDEFTTALSAYEAFTGDEVRENFARYHARPRFRVIVRPETPGSP